MRTLTQEQVDIIIKNHQIYLDDKNKIEYKANLSYSDLSGAKLDIDIILIGGIGSVHRTTQYIIDYDEVICGCFKGNLEQFEIQVKETHRNNPKYLMQYLGIIEYFKSLKAKKVK